MKKFILVGLMSLLFVNSSFANEPSAHVKQISADEAFNRLIDGNKRFVKLKLMHPDESNKRRHELASGQHPIAIVLSCSDSRVPPELLFDQGLGDLFIIRDAGNVADDVVIGSLEYAAGHLNVPLVIVLGHEKCGAVTAAVDGHADSEHIEKILDQIKPAVITAKKEQGDLIDNTVRENVKYVVDEIKNSNPVLAKKYKNGELKVVGAYYHLEDGKVELLK
ncbi:MAG: carbonic anhydrase [bacterium]